LYNLVKLKSQVSACAGAVILLKHVLVQGESAKKQWREDHTEFIAENEDNLEFLRVYTDGSLMKKDGETT